MKSFSAAIAALSLSMVAAPASAAITFSFAQVGSDVVLTGTGSLDLTDATVACCGGQDGFVTPSQGALAVGGPAATVAAAYFTSNDGAFGPGGFLNGLSDGGDVFGMNAVEFGGYVTFYQGYQSGASLSGTTVFADQTFASLGLISGTYTYSIPNDVVRVIIPAAVPEPAAWAMMIAGFGLVGGAVRRQRAVVARA